jgi:hypothetical protein
MAGQTQARLIIDSSEAGLPAAPGYYRVFPREPSPLGAMGFSPQRTTLMQSPSLAAVLDGMVQAGAGGAAMLVCHSWENGAGLDLPLVAGGHTGVVPDAIAKLDDAIQTESVEPTVRAAPEDTAAEKATKRQFYWDMFQKLRPGRVNSTFDLKEAPGLYTICLDEVARQILQLPPNPTCTATLRRLIAKVNTVRGLRLSRVELRSCKLGNDEPTMRSLKGLFGCGKLLAPRVETFYCPNIYTFTMAQVADYFIRLENAPTTDRWNRPIDPNKRVPGPRGKPQMTSAMYAALFRHHTRFFFTFDAPPQNVPQPRFGIPGGRIKELFALNLHEVRRFHYRGFMDVPAGRQRDAMLKMFVSSYIMPGAKLPSYSSFPIAGFWLNNPRWPFVLPNDPWPRYIDFINCV